MKTAELTGWSLDWAVAKAQDLPEAADRKYFALIPRYSYAWSQGGPLIDREFISTVYDNDYGIWLAAKNVPAQSMFGFGGDFYQEGPTRLIAAMRAYVVSKLGEEVDVPEELS